MAFAKLAINRRSDVTLNREMKIQNRMDKKETERKYQKICEDTNLGHIKSALDGLGALIRNERRTEYYLDLENITENYQSLLNYAFEGAEDPERREILNKISAAILEMSDDVKDALTTRDHPQKNLEKAMLLQLLGDDPQAVSERLEEFLSEKNLQQMLKETGNNYGDARPLENIFRLMWLTHKIKDTTYEKVSLMAHSTILENHEKCLVVSAITLSLLDYFDPRKILLLMDFISEHEIEVYQRALIGLGLVLIGYDQRIKFYPEIMLRLDELSQDEGIQQDMEALLLQLLMAQETETIVKAFEEEVLPEMKKMMPKFEDKLQLDKIFGEEDLEGKNPDWKNMIDEVPGLFERIEKFTRMQMEGGDVFLSTFSQLKRFDFFTRMSNWFVPFYADHPDLKNNETDEEKIFSRLLEGLGRAFYLCNSDKYSFALNFSAVPPPQRSLIMSYFEAELDQMKEMAAEEDILNPANASNAIFIQYIQDLYRFFKLYPFHNEFNDIFKKKIRFTELYFYKKFFEHDNFTARLAVFYFDKNHYPEAITMNLYLIEKEGPKGEYYEKIGYSYQKLAKYKEAIDFYKKAELFDSDHLWILKKLGWCSIKLNDYAGALKYFEECAKIQPDDLTIQAQVGHCYLNLKNFEDALTFYTKVLYFQPDNLKILRPIAYCQFVLGKLNHAEESYQKILDNTESPGPFDFMNAAHVKLCLNKRKEALTLYKKCKTSVHFATNSFKSAFEEDIPYLLKNGISEEDLPLLMDYLLFQVE
jgi:tetratricopeptide (TPR) repeat protein